MLGFTETRDLLLDYGLPLAPGRLAASVEEAVEASREFLGPGRDCVLKLISVAHSHKTDGGFVALGLRDQDAVRTASLDMLARLGPGEAYEGFLVQPMLSSSREFMLGAQVDPQFGPLVAFGPGGILVDLLGGVDFLMAPFSLAQAWAFLARNPALPLFDRVRGQAAVDRTELAACLMSLGRLIVENAHRVASIDLNPLVSVPETGALLALDFRSEGLPS